MHRFTLSWAITRQPLVLLCMRLFRSRRKSTSRIHCLKKPSGERCVADHTAERGVPLEQADWLAIRTNPRVDGSDQVADHGTRFNDLHVNLSNKRYPRTTWRSWVLPSTAASPIRLGEPSVHDDSTVNWRTERSPTALGPSMVCIAARWAGIEPATSDPNLMLYR